MPHCLFGLVLLGGAAGASGQSADVQFFGDVLVTSKSRQQTQSSAANPSLFADVDLLLRSARHNVVNLEGVITTALTPLAHKSFYLRMPPSSAEILLAAGIDAVTLANNHTMDFGFAGLLSTMTALSRAGIAYTGAGITSAAASTPILLPIQDQTICLLAFSKTLPASFWATSRRAGTAFASPEVVGRAVADCAGQGRYTVVAFHWGQEGHGDPIEYQRTLAHLAIDAGANLIIGHHPHIVQDIEVYRERPIFYSLGNFAFGSEPASGDQEGLAVRLTFQPGHPLHPRVELVPLAVHSRAVRFRPRPMDFAESSSLARHLPVGRACRWQAGAWACAL